jgi:hypothetical protein
MNFENYKNQINYLFSKERALQLQANRLCTSQTNDVTWLSIIDQQQACYDQQDQVLALAEKNLSSYDYEVLRNMAIQHSQIIFSNQKIFVQN